jgi:hypothetical protein
MPSALGSATCHPSFVWSGMAHMGSDWADAATGVAASNATNNRTFMTPPVPCHLPHVRIIVASAGRLIPRSGFWRQVPGIPLSKPPSTARRRALPTTDLCWRTILDKSCGDPSIAAPVVVARTHGFAVTGPSGGPVAEEPKFVSGFSTRLSRRVASKAEPSGFRTLIPPEARSLVFDALLSRNNAPDQFTRGYATNLFVQQHFRHC